MLVFGGASKVVREVSTFTLARADISDFGNQTWMFSAVTKSWNLVNAMEPPPSRAMCSAVVQPGGSRSLKPFTPLSN